MKEAQREHLWRRIGLEWGDNPRVSSIGLSSFPGFEDGQLQPFGGLTVLCGVNASGKTRLLTSIARTGSPEAAPEVSTTTSGVTFPAAYIDVFWLLQKQRVSLSTDRALPERVAQAELTRLRAEDHRIANYLLGQAYERIEFAELDSTDDSGILDELAVDAASMQLALEFRSDVVPYFEVERGGHTYTSLELSQGELAGLSLIWALSHGRTGQLTLVDEPETFLSPVSAQRALDVVVHYACKFKSPAIVSSHSFLGLSQMPQEHLVLLKPTLMGQTRLAIADKVGLWQALRLRAPKAIILVVEDRAAYDWLRWLLGRIEYPFTDLVDVWIAGDAPAVRASGNFPVCDQATLSIWGVADGDERKKGIKGSKNLIFLPGENSPEGLIIAALREQPPLPLGLPNARLEEALSAHPELDAHDRVKQIAEHLGRPLTAFRLEVLAAWLETAAGRAALSAFRAELELIRPPGVVAETAISPTVPVGLPRPSLVGRLRQRLGIN